MSPEPAGEPVAAPRAVTSARTKLLVSFGAGIAGGAVAALAGADRVAPLVGWDILALVYAAWVWSTVWGLDPESSQAEANREDPDRQLADLVMLGAAIASLIAVGIVLLGVGGGQRKREVHVRGSGSGLRIRVLGPRAHRVHPEIRAALLFGHAG